jgi:hypothetical protein
VEQGYAGLRRRSSTRIAFGVHNRRSESDGELAETVSAMKWRCPRRFVGLRRILAKQIACRPLQTRVVTTALIFIFGLLGRFRDVSIDLLEKDVSDALKDQRWQRDIRYSSDCGELIKFGEGGSAPPQK